MIPQALNVPLSLTKHDIKRLLAANLFESCLFYPICHVDNNNNIFVYIHQLWLVLTFIPFKMPLDQRIPEIKVEKCVEMDYAPSEPFKYRRSPRKRPYFMVEVPFVNLLPENPKASVMLDGDGDLPPLQLSDDEGEGDAASRLQCGPNDKAKIASGESSSSDDDSGSSSSSDEQPLILNCSICQVQCPGQVAFRRHMIQHFSPAVVSKSPSLSILKTNLYLLPEYNYQGPCEPQ